MKNKMLIIILILLIALLATANTRFIVVGDTHFSSPYQDLAKTILYEIVNAAISEQVDFVFLAGDLIIRGFSNAAEKDSVLKDWYSILDILDNHDMKLLACRGNNDYNIEAWDSLFTGKFAFPQNGPEEEKNLTYAYEFNDVLFISLDLYKNTHKVNQAWLEEQFANNDRPYIFVAGHEPAFKLLHSNCMASFPEQRDIFWQSLINAGVKAYFCGHDHFYDHLIIDDGDGNQNNDVHQVIVGTGGGGFHSDAEYNGNNGRWTPIRMFHDRNYGYLLVEVNESEAKLTWKHRLEENIFVDGGDSFQLTTLVEKALEPMESYHLFQNYPNPFNSTTVIKYYLPQISKVELGIYNLLGENVSNLVSCEQNPGNYSIEWDANNISSGIYFCRLIAENRYVGTSKIIVIK
jgi:predicted phosphodiesterase